jgi:hypothetical protein
MLTNQAAGSERLYKFSLRTILHYMRRPPLTKFKQKTKCDAGDVVKKVRVCALLCDRLTRKGRSFYQLVPVSCTYDLSNSFQVEDWSGKCSSYGLALLQ